MTDCADKTGYEPSTERTGHRNLLREVCGQVAEIAGKGRIDRTRRVRTDRDSNTHLVWLGIGVFGAPVRFLANSSRVVWRKIGSHSFTRTLNLCDCLFQATPPIACFEQCVKLSPVKFMNIANQWKTRSCTFVNFTVIKKQGRVFCVNGTMSENKVNPERKERWKRN